MLQLKKIRKSYLSGTDSVWALGGVDLSFRKNEFVSILGPSGCGKTTLLNIIGGLDRYTDGDLVIDGRSTKGYRDGDWDVYRNRSIGFVFQSYNLIPHQTVLQNVELAMTLSGVSKSERRRRAEDALSKVGLSDQLKKKPSQMSGGQMQRVAIARALVNDPEILLADEPTGALDSTTSVQVMELLKEVARDRLVIMVTHNPDLAEQYSTRIITLKDGLVTGDSMPYSPADEAAERADTASAAFAALPASKKPKKEKRAKKKPMSLFTALSLSMNNLMTKKGRTFLTSFAGSIGIIGIALILSLSNGIQNYIDSVQKDTLSSSPITLQSEQLDMSGIFASLMKAEEKKKDRTDDRVYANTIMYELLSSYTGTQTKKNDLGSFRRYMEKEENGMSDLISAVQYRYDLPLTIYRSMDDGTVKQVEPSTVFQKVMPEGMSGTGGTSGGISGGMSSLSSSMMTNNIRVWGELLPARNGDPVHPMLKEQYDLLWGQWPTEKNQVVLILNENNEISDMALYALGLKDDDEIQQIMKDVLSGNKDKDYGSESYTYEELGELSFRMLTPDDYYVYDAASDTYADMRENEKMLSLVMSDGDVGLEIKIAGIIRPNEDAVSTALTGTTIGYISGLSDYLMEKTNGSAVIKAQKDSRDRDVLNGLAFDDGTKDNMTDGDKLARFKAYAAALSASERAELYRSIVSVPTEEQLSGMVSGMLSSYPDRQSKVALILQVYTQQAGMDEATVSGYIEKMSDAELDEAVATVAAEGAKKQYAAQVEAQLSAVPAEQLSAMLDGILNASDEKAGAALYDAYMPNEFSDVSYKERLKLLGEVDPDSPSMIAIYAETFENKDAIADAIAAYNKSVDEDHQIEYTDYAALLMSGITTIINVISYVLVAFVSISLVVSSIMIGIITYISVLERTKEIGILRAIGASKGDVSRVFNAETLIVGFVSGAIGILMTVLLCFPINAIIRHLSGIQKIGAVLPPLAGVILVLISMALTFIAGLVPAKIAARKDPVVALRSE